MNPYYSSGDITIYRGDSSQVLKTLPDESIDMTLTSPPYDNLRSYKGYSFDFETIAQELYRLTKPGGVVVWVVGDETVDGSETGTSFKQALYFKEIGFNLHDTMIYQKMCLSYPETNRYYPSFEYMFILSRGKPKTVNLIADKRNEHFGDTVRGYGRQPRSRRESQDPSHGTRPQRGLEDGRRSLLLL